MQFKCLKIGLQLNLALLQGRWQPVLTALYVKNKPTHKIMSSWGDFEQVKSLG
jgi:hypothetical protein